MEWFIILMFAATVYGNHLSKDAVDIRKFTDKPYCETQNVAGKELKRCLKAVEVQP